MESTPKSNWITVENTVDVSNIKVPKLYEGCLESVIVLEKDIKQRIYDLTEEIAKHYADRPFVIVVVLKGSFLVFSEMYEHLMQIYSDGKYNNKIVPEFIRLRNLRNETQMNEVIMKGVNELDIEGKEIILIEDIIESGASLKTVLKVIHETKKPKDVKIFSLFIKKDRPQFDFNLDYVGFEIPNKFCVGYGVDYNEKFRDLYSLCVINQHGLDKFKSE